MTFEKFVSNAPIVLFKLGWVLAALTLLSSIVGLFSVPSSAFVFALTSAITATISALLVPWIAAAVIWRIDLYLENAK